MTTAPPPVAPAADGALDKHPARIAGMFDAIARRYDLLNHLLSAGADWYWRWRAIRALHLGDRAVVLDLCTGTCDLAIEALRRGGARRVVGIDFAGEMLRVGRQKLRDGGLEAQAPLVRGDATSIPLADATVNAVTVAFGIRNVEAPDVACREMFRVLRRGGRLAVLEFAMPRAPLLRRAYAWYFARILPRIGRMISKHEDAYTYLPTSVGAFFAPDEFCALLARSGFGAVKAVPLTFGIVYLYVAIRD